MGLGFSAAKSADDPFVELCSEFVEFVSTEISVVALSSSCLSDRSHGGKSTRVLHGIRQMRCASVQSELTRTSVALRTALLYDVANNR